MAKSPKNDKDLPKDDQAADEVAQDAIEDAVVIDEPDDDKRDEDLEEVETSDETSETPEDPWSKSDTAEVTAEDAPDQDEEASTPDSDKNETAAGTEIVPAAQPEKRGAGGFITLLLGGLIAGGIGFGAAQYAEGDWPFNTAGTDEPDPIATALEDQTNQIAALAEQVESNTQGLSSLSADTSVDDLGGQLRADIVATQTRIEELSGRLQDFEARISDLEKMPGGASAEAAQTAAEAYERELAQMREMLDREIAALKAEQEQAQTLEVNAAEAAQAAAARAAMSRIMAAMESGQPFGDALFDLTQSADTEAPAALASVADRGAPTLASLQNAFPAVARAALDDALREMVANGDISRGEAFLRTQLGTRSLEPKEGDDPDAILSRAEFALGNGRIDEALKELAAMPDASQPALADWIERAETRQAALDAAAELSQTLNQ